PGRADSGRTRCGEGVGGVGQQQIDADPRRSVRRRLLTSGLAASGGAALGSLLGGPPRAHAAPDAQGIGGYTSYLPATLLSAPALANTPTLTLATASFAVGQAILIGDLNGTYE